MSAGIPSARASHCKILLPTENRKIPDELLKLSKNRAINNGDMENVSDTLDVYGRQVSNVWNQYQTSDERNKDASFESGR